MTTPDPKFQAFLDRLYKGRFGDLEAFGEFVGAISCEPFQLSHDGVGNTYLICEIRLREREGPLPTYRVTLRQEAGSAEWTYDSGASSMRFVDEAISLHLA